MEDVLAPAANTSEECTVQKSCIKLKLYLASLLYGQKDLGRRYSTTLGTSLSTGYDWTTTSSATFSEKLTYRIDVPVTAGTVVRHFFPLRKETGNNNTNFEFYGRSTSSK